jgi:hypothetical protein
MTLGQTDRSNSTQRQTFRSSFHIELNYIFKMVTGFDYERTNDFVHDGRSYYIYS